MAPWPRNCERGRDAGPVSPTQTIQPGAGFVMDLTARELCERSYECDGNPEGYVCVLQQFPQITLVQRYNPMAVRSCAEVTERKRRIRVGKDRESERERERVRESKKEKERERRKKVKEKEGERRKRNEEREK